MNKLQQKENNSKISAEEQKYAYKHPSTIWEQIQEEFIVLIIRGEFKSGDRVYSISETAEKYKCGKSTAQKVLDNLCEEKILYKLHGKGFFVNDDKNSMKKLGENYYEEMNRILLRYVSMGKKIGIANEQIIEQVKNALEQKG